MKLIDRAYLSKAIDTIAAQTTQQQRDSVLAPVQKLVTEIEQKGVRVVACDRLPVDPRMPRCSFATLSPDGEKTIVLERHSIEFQAESAGLTYAQALQGVLLHEYGHLCGNPTETGAWDSIRPSANLPQSAIDRMASSAMHQIRYQATDLKPALPQWLDRFNELIKQRWEYSLAWDMTASGRDGLTPEQVFDALWLGGWDFDCRWEICYGDLSTGLWKRALSIGDHKQAAKVN